MTSPYRESPEAEVKDTIPIEVEDVEVSFFVDNLVLQDICQGYILYFEEEAYKYDNVKRFVRNGECYFQNAMDYAYKRGFLFFAATDNREAIIIPWSHFIKAQIFKRTKRIINVPKSRLKQ